MSGGRIAIVGGGITGLATAWFLRQRGAGDRVVLFEASDRFGGNIRTEKHGDLTIDAGPDAWVTAKPEATKLAEALGLGGEFIHTPERNRKVYIAGNDGMTPVPSGLVLGIPTTLASIARTRLFTTRGKARMAADLVIPRRRFAGDEDESISEFVTRRLGREACDKIVAPLLGGIFSGDADELSIRAGVPQLVKLEEQYGSLIRGARAQQRARVARGMTHAFVSLPGGVQRLVDRLVERLDGVDLRRQAAVKRIVPEGGRYAVELASGACEVVDAAVLTSPAFVLSPMLADMNARLASLLGELRYGSTALVFLAIPRAAVDDPLDSTGFLVPRSTGSDLVAVTVISSKWEGRTPKDVALFRLFFGGNRGPRILDESDDQLVRIGIRELRRFIPFRGEPRESFVRRLPKASPQPRKGHLRWLADVRAELARHPGLVLAGNGYGGIGIPDCVRQAEDAANAVMAP